MVIKTLKQLQDFSSKFNWKEFSFDTETTDLDYFKLDLVGISLYDGKNLAYLDCWNTSLSEDIKHWLLLKFGDCIKLGSIIIGHNLVFDIKVLTKVCGKREVNLLLKNTKLIDTMLAAYLIDERLECGLKPLADKYLGRIPVTYEQAIRYPFNSPEFAAYAEADAKNTWDLWQVFKPILKEQQLEQVFEIECGFIPVQVEMELTGVELDTDLLKYQETHLDLLKCQLEEEMTECLEYDKVYQGRFWDRPENINPVNYGSSAQVVKMIQKRLGITLTIETDKGGRKSVKKEVINSLLDKHPFFPLYQKYQAIIKLLNTYCTKYWDLIKPDGRIHPEFHTIRSGRSIATKPNLLNQAKTNELVSEINVRNLFVSRI